MQDVVILYKKAGHYEPVLGVPEMNRVAPVPPPATRYGFIDWLLGR